MPTIRYQIRNEYGLADPELYGAVDKDDPEALLEGVAMAGLVGVLRQLGDLAEFAAEIFHDLHEEVMATSARGHGLMLRVQQVEAEFPSVEKAFLSQINPSNFACNDGIDWHANLQIDQNLLTRGHMPRFILDSYEECRGPPRLFTLDKFDIAGAGACLKRYSDPSFFKLNISSADMLEEEIPRDKRVRKIKKKGSRLRKGETQTLESLFLPHAESNSRATFELIAEKAPTRRVKFKTRHVNGLDISSGRNHMERLLEVLSSQQTSVTHLKSVDSTKSAPEVHGIALDISAKQLISGTTNPARSATNQGETELPKNELENQMIKDELSETLSAIKTYQNFDFLNQQKMLTDADYKSENSADGKRSGESEKIPVMQVMDQKLADHEYETGSSADGCRSDDVRSEPENFVDALNTMESEVETDSESNAKTVLGFFNKDTLRMDSDSNVRQQELEAQFSERQSVENSKTTLDLNSTLRIRKSSSSLSDTHSNLSDTQPTQENLVTSGLQASPEIFIGETHDNICREISQDDEGMGSIHLLSDGICDAKSSDDPIFVSEIRKVASSSCVTDSTSVPIYVHPRRSHDGPQSVAVDQNDFHFEAQSGTDEVAKHFNVSPLESRDHSGKPHPAEHAAELILEDMAEAHDRLDILSCTSDTSILEKVPSGCGEESLLLQTEPTVGESKEATEQDAKSCLDGVETGQPEDLLLEISAGFVEVSLHGRKDEDACEISRLGDSSVELMSDGTAVNLTMPDHLSKTQYESLLEKVLTVSSDGSSPPLTLDVGEPQESMKQGAEVSLGGSRSPAVPDFIPDINHMVEHPNGLAVEMENSLTPEKDAEYLRTTSDGDNAHDMAESEFSVHSTPPTEWGHFSDAEDPQKSHDVDLMEFVPSYSAEEAFPDCMLFESKAPDGEVTIHPMSISGDKKFPGEPTEFHSQINVRQMAVLAQNDDLTEKVTAKDDSDDLDHFSIYSSEASSFLVHSQENCVPHEAFLHLHKLDVHESHSLQNLAALDSQGASDITHSLGDFQEKYNSDTGPYKLGVHESSSSLNVTALASHGTPNITHSSNESQENCVPDKAILYPNTLEVHESHSSQNLALFESKGTSDITHSSKEFQENCSDEAILHPYKLDVHESSRSLNLAVLDSQGTSNITHSSNESQENCVPDEVILYPNKPEVHESCSSENLVLLDSQGTSDITHSSKEFQGNCISVEAILHPYKLEVHESSNSLNLAALDSQGTPNVTHSSSESQDDEVILFPNKPEVHESCSSENLVLLDESCCLENLVLLDSQGASDITHSSKEFQENCISDEAILYPNKLEVHDSSSSPNLALLDSQGIPNITHSSSESEDDCVPDEAISQSNKLEVHESCSLENLTMLGSHGTSDITHSSKEFQENCISDEAILYPYKLEIHDSGSSPNLAVLDSQVIPNITHSSNESDEYCLPDEAILHSNKLEVHESCSSQNLVVLDSQGTSDITHSSKEFQENCISDEAIVSPYKVGVHDSGSSPNPVVLDSQGIPNITYSSNESEEGYVHDEAILQSNKLELHESCGSQDLVVLDTEGIPDIMHSLKEENQQASAPRMLETQLLFTDSADPSGVTLLNDVCHGMPSKNVLTDVHPDKDQVEPQYSLESEQSLDSKVALQCHGSVKEEISSFIQFLLEPAVPLEEVGSDLPACGVLNDVSLRQEGEHLELHIPTNPVDLHDRASEYGPKFKSHVNSSNDEESHANISNEQIDVSDGPPSNPGICGKLEPEAAVSSALDSFTTLTPFPSFSMAISDITSQQSSEPLPDEPVQKIPSQDVEGPPPLPPLPPLQWRMGKLPLGSLSSNGYIFQPMTGTNPFLVPSTIDKEHANDLQLQSEILQPANPFADLPAQRLQSYQPGLSKLERQVTQPLGLSELPPVVDDGRNQHDALTPEGDIVHPASQYSIAPVAGEKHLCGHDAFRGVMMCPSSNPFAPSSVSENKISEHAPLLVREMVPHLRDESSQIGQLPPGLDFERCHGALHLERDILQPQSQFLVNSGLGEIRRQHGFELLESENLQYLNLPMPVPTAGQHGFVLSNEEITYVQYDVLPSYEDESLNGRPHSIRNRPRDPLIEAVAAHDRSTLRKVSEIVPPSKPEAEERNSLLEQIRNKTFNLKPTAVTKPNIKGPPTNLKVAAILEKANAIRQACAGSDEDDDDSWSDS